MTDGLVTRMEKAAQSGQEIVLLDGPEPAPVSWAEVHDDARRTAAAMQARGVGPGDRVAVLAMTSRPMVTSLYAAWLAGAAVIVLPLPTRLEPADEFRARTLERIRLGDVTLVLADPELAAAADDGTRSSMPVGLADLVAGAARFPVGAYERPDDDPERTVVLQFTSGSTADPKGVVIPERCLLDNMDSVLDRAPLEVGEDVIVSWLPLYHDMGLIYNAALAAMTGVQFVLAPPTRFITSPASWMEWMAAFGGTWSIGPNFAFALAARWLARSAPLDLSRCRRLGSGAEPIDPDAMDRFTAAAAAHGLDPRTLFAGYGMAEAVVGVSFTPPGLGLGVDVVDAVTLEREAVAAPAPPAHPSARRLTRCGPPIRGMEVRIADGERGDLVGERQVGEIELRGPSVVPGYFRRPDATAAAFRDGGWLRTGDLGYLADGELVVCGRLKDVIIVGGRNVFPEDIERPAQTVPGVRPGNVIAFGVDAGRKGEAVVVVAEVKDGDPTAIRDEIARVARESAGVRPHDVVLLAPGTIPKTSSGKLRRSACRARYTAGELVPL